ncbi:hypothetical protein [Sinomonas sp. RB5]
MYFFGDPDTNYIPVRMRACLDRSFTDLTIDELDNATVTGGTWTDNGTGEAYRLINFRGECIIFREDDWPGDEEGILLYQDSAITFDEVAAEASSERAWRESFGALLALADSVYDVVTERAKPLISQVRAELGDEMFTDPEAVAPVLEAPDVDAAFRAFEDACRRRMPYCADIELAFWDEDDELPEVRFGHRPGTEDQILYQLKDNGAYGDFMYLNGLETDPGSYEEDIAEHYQDPWARVGALRAARDLIAIRDAAGNVAREARRAVDAQLYQEELDIEVGVRLDETDAKEAAMLHRRTFADRRRAAFKVVFERITAFLNQDEPQAVGAGR